MGLRETKRAAVRARILATCAALFRERGFDETSIDEIIGRCEISRQTFFNYFAGKDAVLAELGLSWLEQQAIAPSEGARNAAGKAVLPAMRAAIAAQARAMEMDEAFVRLVVTRSAIFGSTGNRQKTGLREGLTKLFGAIASVISAAQQQGEINDEIDPHVAAELIATSLFMAVRLWALGYGSSERGLEQRMGEALDLLESGLRLR